MIVIIRRSFSIQSAVSAMRATRVLLALGVVLSAYLRGATAQHTQLDAQLTFCVKDDKKAETTLRAFWQAVEERCTMDPMQLLDLYERAGADSGDKCGRLLRHHIRKTLVPSCASVLAEALISGTFRSSYDVKVICERLSQIEDEHGHEQLLRAVWERAIDEVYFYVDYRALLEDVFQAAIGWGAKVVAFLSCQRRALNYGDIAAGAVANQSWLTRIMHSKAFDRLPERLREKVVELYGALPEGPRKFEQYKTGVLGLLNDFHSEFLYVPRENGPSQFQRTPLTWSQVKNETDSDGELQLEFDDVGNVSLGNFFGAALKFLYVDEAAESPFFWIGEGRKDSRWWQLQWAATGHSFALRNTQTRNLLCATRPYDENRRYVTLVKPGEYSSQCFWSFVVLKRKSLGA